MLVCKTYNNYEISVLDTATNKTRKLTAVETINLLRSGARIIGLDFITFTGNVIVKTDYIYERTQTDLVFKILKADKNNVVLESERQLHIFKLDNYGGFLEVCRIEKEPIYEVVSIELKEIQSACYEITVTYKGKDNKKYRSVYGNKGCYVRVFDRLKVI
jgi:hypothetical protein